MIHKRTLFLSDEAVIEFDKFFEKHLEKKYTDFDLELLKLKLGETRIFIKETSIKLDDIFKDFDFKKLIKND